MDLPDAILDRRRTRALGQWQTGWILETCESESHPRQAEAIRAPEYSVLFVIGSMQQAAGPKSALPKLAPSASQPRTYYQQRQK
jgi:hypothetical protein